MRIYLKFNSSIPVHGDWREVSSILIGDLVMVGGPTNFGGWGGFGPTQYLYDSYDNNDKRKKAFFITEYAGVTQTPPSSGKFWDAETGNVIEDDNLNFTMIRYADVL